MQIFSWRSFVAWLLAMAISAATFAADTGTISGAVFDQYGQPVAVAIVSLTGDQLPVGRVAETGSNGSYRFEYVPPGVYAVVADKEGTGSARRTVIVEVGKDTVAAMRSGLFWGTIGAARELIARMSEGAGLSEGVGSQFRRTAARGDAAIGEATKLTPDPLTPAPRPQVFLTGGAAASVAKLLAKDARYLPDLTLSGIAITAQHLARRE